VLFFFFEIGLAMLPWLTGIHSISQVGLELSVLLHIVSDCWNVYYFLKSRSEGQVWSLIPVILATQVAEIKSIMVQGQSRKKVSETPSQQQARCGGSCLSSELHRCK
jgi:hypothetical protein